MQKESTLVGFCHFTLMECDQLIMQTCFLNHDTNKNKITTVFAGI